MSDLTNGPPAAGFYFWCLDGRCDTRGSTYPQAVPSLALQESIRRCDFVCDVDDLFTWTRQEELDVRRQEFDEKHKLRMRTRAQREDYACTQCFLPGCSMTPSDQANWCFCDFCSCR